MKPLQLTAAAERDLAAIFFASETRFGARAADRYRRLVRTALRDLRVDPERPGVRAAPAVGAHLLLYHLRHSRARAGRDRVARPRHVLVFSVLASAIVVRRVLHEAMDLPVHLQDLDQ